MIASHLHRSMARAAQALGVLVLLQLGGIALADGSGGQVDMRAWLLPESPRTIVVNDPATTAQELRGYLRTYPRASWTTALEVSAGLEKQDFLLGFDARFHVLGKMTFPDGTWVVVYIPASEARENSVPLAAIAIIAPKAAGRDLAWLIARLYDGTEVAGLSDGPLPVEVSSTGVLGMD